MAVAGLLQPQTQEIACINPSYDAPYLCDVKLDKFMEVVWSLPAEFYY